MMKNRMLTCIVCPRGCALSVELGECGEVISVTGNACPRGRTYAEDECTHPKRTVTSTVRCDNGGIVSVKTSSAVPKELVFEVMKEINGVRAASGLKIGDVVIKNVAGTDADVIATSNSEES